MSRQYIDIELVRDSVYSPWGVRIGGGNDYSMPITVTRVRARTPATVAHNVQVSPTGAGSGLLKTGDILVVINGYNTQHMTHAEATQVIAAAGAHLRLGVSRCVHVYCQICKCEQRRSICH
jgi:hypothetical protein